MSAQKTISNSFTVTTIEDPVSVQAQYAPNNNPTAGQIHNVWQDGDLYMRTRETDSNVWSSWHKIVGESGGETGYTFGISAYKTTANASTAPSDITSWADAPMAVTSSKPYLWAKVQQKSWNASTQSYDVDSTRYIRLTGEAGANAPYIELSRTTILYNANNEGKSTASQNFPITYALKVNGNTCTISSVNNITISLPSNVTVVNGTKTTSGCTINCTHSVVMSGVITITITGTYNGQTYTASSSITVEANKEGEKGEKGDTGDQGGKGDRGKMGRIYYYAQEWSNSSSVSYQVTDAEAPYFLYNGNYWVFNPEDNGTYTMAAMGTPSSSNTNWKMMVTDFKYIITEAIFGSFAHFGSAIISGDWLMSTNGYINGTAFNNTNISGGIVGGSSFSVKAYTLFDENYPLGDNTTIHESSDTTSVASSSTSVTRASSIYLTAGYTYCLVCSGYTSNASHPVYGRIQDSSGNYTVPVNLNSTSAVQRSGYFRVASSR